MDSITHIFLASALTQVAAGRRLGRTRAFLIGAIAATLPDLDIFIHTGNEMTNHALHRHFTHALVFVPVLAALALIPFLFHRKSRPLLGPLYLVAMLAGVSHTLLDVLTSYGTMIFWPFSQRRIALDIIAVTDPLYTLPLILGVWLAWKWRSARPAWAALLVSCTYLGIATWQHARALDAQSQLLASRHVSVPQNPRVLPQVGAVISYRSIYIDQGQIHADAIRVPFLAAPAFKPGGTLPVLAFADLHVPTAPSAAKDFAAFAELADGFVARAPADPLLISDQRYTYFPEGLEPVWGLRLENTETPLFRITPRWNYLGKLARDLFRPGGYAAIPLPQDPAHP